jgi:putative membrane protein insertion efficiency factor
VVNLSLRNRAHPDSDGAKRARAVMIFLPVFMIRTYQVIIRPLLIGSCKFYPSCSEYAVEALQTHGLGRGFALAVRRVCRCHPFSPGGIDPVPERDPPDTPTPAD